MKYYKDESGTIFAFEADGTQDGLITEAMRKLTTAEVNAHIAKSSAASTAITLVEFVGRFTDEEFETLAGMAISDTKVKAVYDVIMISPSVEPGSKRVYDLLSMLVNSGALTKARSKKIVSG